MSPENPLVASLLKALDGNDIESAKRVVDRIRKAVDDFVSLPVPIIAAINGLAYGGGMDLAGQIAQNGPKAVRHALSVIRQSESLPLDKALELETEMAAKLIASGECIHGITACMEKRKPIFPD